VQKTKEYEYHIRIRTSLDGDLYGISLSISIKGKTMESNMGYEPIDIDLHLTKGQWVSKNIINGSPIKILSDNCFHFSASTDAEFSDFIGYTVHHPRHGMDGGPIMVVRTGSNFCVLGKASLPKNKWEAWVKTTIEKDLNEWQNNVTKPEVSDQYMDRVNREEEQEGKYNSEQMAAAAFAQLQTIVEEGKMPDCYKEDFHHFLCDWFPDLPWDETKQKKAINWIIKHDDFKRVEDALKAKYGISIYESMTAPETIPE
jgi:hypothetical protein